tara:strand:+ start:252 stop:2291 length:2040 start_codon:yes stop_codon:yes gene_type:complete
MDIQLKHNFIVPVLLFLISCNSAEISISEDNNLFNPIPTQTIQKNLNTENNLKDDISIPSSTLSVTSTPSPISNIISIPTIESVDITKPVEEYPLLVQSWGVPEYFINKETISINNITKIEPSRLDLYNLVNRLNNIQIQRPGSELLIPNKKCEIEENEKFLVIDINEYIVRPIIAKQVMSNDMKDSRYCWYIENQYVKHVNTELLELWIQKFNTEIHPIITNVFYNTDINPYIYVVITNLNPGIAGYYSDSNNYPVNLHYGSNEVDIIFIDIDQIKNGEQSFLSTLTHELTHLYQFQINSYSNSWIKEGTAELITNSVGLQRPLDSNIFSRPISLSTLNNPNLQQYGYFTFFFLYLQDRFNPLNLYELLQHENKSIEGIIDYLKTNHNYQNHSKDLLNEWGLEVLNCIIENCSFYDDFINSTPVIELNDSQTIEMLPLSLQFYKILDSQNTSIQISTEILNENNDIWWSGNGDLIDNMITFEFEIKDLDNYSLYFDTYFDIEGRFDLVYLEISKDGGASWEILSTPAMNSQSSSFYALGPHYTNQIEDWINEEILIGNLNITDKLLVRFEYITDDSVNNKGFYIKDITLISKEANIINPNKIYLEGFKNHSDIILASCMLTVIHHTEEKGMIVKDKIFIDSTEMINYDFSKDEQVYIMLQCNDFEGEYSTSINLEYTV